MFGSNIPNEVKNYLIEHHSDGLKKISGDKVIFNSASEAMEFTSSLNNAVFDGLSGLSKNYAFYIESYSCNIVRFTRFKG